MIFLWTNKTFWTPKRCNFGLVELVRKRLENSRHLMIPWSKTAIGYQNQKTGLDWVPFPHFYHAKIVIINIRLLCPYIARKKHSRTWIIHSLIDPRRFLWNSWRDWISTSRKARDERVLREIPPLRHRFYRTLLSRMVLGMWTLQKHAQYAGHR